MEWVKLLDVVKSFVNILAKTERQTEMTKYKFDPFK